MTTFNQSELCSAKICLLHKVQEHLILAFDAITLAFCHVQV